MSADEALRKPAMKLKLREMCALKDAIDRPGGWGLFMRATTEKLAAKGYFKKELHQALGMQWRITDAGRTAYAEASR